MSSSTFTPTNLNPSGDLAQDVGRSDLRFGTGYFANLSDGDRVVATGGVVTESELQTALSGKADNAAATADKGGLMSSADKRKLDGFPDAMITSHGQLDDLDAPGSHPAGAIVYSPAQTVADALRQIFAILPNKVDAVDVSNFATVTELLNGLGSKADWAYVDNSLSGKADKAMVDAALAGKAEAVHAHALADVNGLEQILEHTATIDYVDAGLAEKASKATATQTAAGLMSASDKAKLDELDQSGVPIATIDTVGVVKPDGVTIVVDPDGTARVTSLPPGSAVTNHADLQGRDAAGAHPSSAIAHDGSTVAAALTALAEALAGKANASHTQAIATIINLQSTLDAKANTSALASYATTTALNTGLGGKANAAHSHAVADVNNLATLLAEKADASALSGYATTTALNNGLAGKANASHSHAVSDVTGLQNSLDAKAPLASPIFTGTPKVPTAAAGTSTDQAASCSFVQTALSGAGGGFSAQEIRTSSGSWVAPKSGNIRVTLIGGGGGGGGGSTGKTSSYPYSKGAAAGGNTIMNGNTALGGGGGGGAEYALSGGGGGAGMILSFYMTVAAGQSYAYTVGAGGAGSAGNLGTSATGGAVSAAKGGGTYGGAATGGGGSGGGRGGDCDTKAMQPSSVVSYRGKGGDGGTNGTLYGGGGGGGGGARYASDDAYVGYGGFAGPGGAAGGKGAATSATVINPGAGGKGGSGAVIIEY